MAKRRASHGSTPRKSVAKKSSSKKAAAPNAAPRDPAIAARTATTVARDAAAIARDAAAAACDAATAAHVAAAAALDAAAAALDAAAAAFDAVAATTGETRARRVVVSSRQVTRGLPGGDDRIVSIEEIRAELQARKKELDVAYKNATKALRRNRKELMSSKYGVVNGVSVQLRTRYGQVVSPLRYVIVVAVARKRSPNELYQPGSDMAKAMRNAGEKTVLAEAFPPSLGEVQIQVVEAEYALALSNGVRGVLAAGSETPAIVPLSSDSIAGGHPIAPPGAPKNFGTIGICVEKGGVHYAITNNHVIGKSSSAIRVVRDIQAGEPIGQALEGTNAHGNDPFVDASLVKLTKASSLPAPPPVKTYEVLNSDEKAIYFAGRKIDRRELFCGALKFGAGTGTMCEGHIVTHDYDSLIVQTAEGVRKVLSLIQARGKNPTFIIGGDSGSLLLLNATYKSDAVLLAVGLVFAMKTDNKEEALACHMVEVLEKLGIDKLDQRVKKFKTSPAGVTTITD